CKYRNEPIHNVVYQELYFTITQPAVSGSRTSFVGEEVSNTAPGGRATPWSEKLAITVTSPTVKESTSACASSHASDASPRRWRMRKCSARRYISRVDSATPRCESTANGPQSRGWG